MKRKVFICFLCLIALFVLSIPVFASQTQSRIVDDANLLTTAEIEELELSSAQFREAHNLDLVILTVNSLNGKTISSFADDYYDYSGYGIGSDASGLILVVSMAERELYISTCGQAIERLSDAELDSIINDTAQILGEGKYAEAFNLFIGLTILNIDIDGLSHQDITNDPEINWAISVLLGAVAAGITVLIMRSTMNTKDAKYSARDYVKEGSYNLYIQRDIFLYSNVSKVRREQNSSSSTSVHRSSSGRSHGGRGGKF